MAFGESKEADYGDVLNAIVARLLDQVEGCFVGNTYFALDPDSGVKDNPGTHIYVVSPASGQFPEGAFVGGGRAMLSVEGGFFVKIHCPSNLDRQSRDAQAITSESLGVLKKATLVLGALIEPWVPQSNGYNATGFIRPVSFELDKDNEDVVRAILLSFAMPFDWSLA